MCGIFGLIAKENSSLNSKSAKKVVDKLFKLSESRGRDAAGFAWRSGEKIFVYKQPVCASKIISSQKYKKIFSKDFGLPFVFMGHARLATNGLEIFNKNNQPLIKDGVVGIHNGIVVNSEKLFKSFPDIKREYEVDTEIILGMVQFFRKKTGLSPTEALKKVFEQIEGSASVAILFDDYPYLILTTNNGSLYTYQDKTNNIFAFASERYILKSLWPDSEVYQIKPKEVKQFELNIGPNLKMVDLSPPGVSPEIILKNNGGEKKLLRYDDRLNLKKCTMCLLSETFPGIKFNENGVCNFCRDYKKQELLGEEKLEKIIAQYRSKDGKPDCLVAFSGGRDSSYGLHYIKNVLKMNPIAFTYDWGLVTDLARRNQARICGKLGIEHIIISADIKRKRENIRKNIKAWLKKPDLGLVPLFMAGDKQFFYYANKLMRQNGIKLMIFCENERLENTRFKSGFCGVYEGNNRWANIPMIQKIKLAFYYAKKFIENPSYLNGSLLDSVFAYISTYFIKHDYIFLYRYIKWDEKIINSTLINNYNWELATDTRTTWRIGDGTAPFYNYIYNTMAGFTENDTFYSNQIREGAVNREEALKLVKEFNQPRYESIKWYCDTIGIDFEETVKTINNAPRLY